MSGKFGWGQGRQVSGSSASCASGAPQSLLGLGVVLPMCDPRGRHLPVHVQCPLVLDQQVPAYPGGGAFSFDSAEFLKARSSVISRPNQDGGVKASASCAEANSTSATIRPARGPS